MPHSYVSCHVHYIFSTKGRLRNITPDIKAELWSYMGGVARQNNMRPLAIGGTDDHAHVLLALPSTISVAKGIQLIKGGSSKWISQRSPSHRGFEWQEGYGAFSVSVSGIEKTTGYVLNQEQHHRHRSFKEEFLAFLKKHGMQYDERYVGG